VEETILSLPDSLEGVYERILRRLSQTWKGRRKELCRKMLKWLALAKRTLQLVEVREALKLDFSSDTSRGFSDDLLISESQLELFCGSLVTVRNQSIRLIHASAHKYLQQPSQEERFDKGLNEFLVDAATENARISGLCTKSLSAYCTSHGQDSKELSAESLKTSFPLLEYCCFHWLSHIAESALQAVVKFESQLAPFICSRHSLYWIESCMTLDPTCWNLFCFMLQTMLDWVADTGAGDVVNIATATSPLSSLRRWGEFILRLVTEYWFLLERRCHEIHDMDLGTLIGSDEHGFLTIFKRDESCEEHVVLSEVDMFVKSGSIPDQRRLPQNTSSTEALHFVVDKTRGILISVDRLAGSSPRLYCQEMATGQRVQPIYDAEFLDDEVALEAQEMILSPSSRFLAVTFSQQPFDMDSDLFVYMALWKIHDKIDFTRKRNSPTWAHKVLSLTTSLRQQASFFSCPQIAFAHDQFLCWQNSRINISTGLEHELPHLRGRNLELGETAFSDNGDTIVFHYHRQSSLEIVRSSGEADTVPFDCARMHVRCVSRTGRYIICNLAPPSQLVIYDSVLRRQSTLNCDINRFIVRDFMFGSDDKLLYVRLVSAATGDGTLWVGSMQSSTFNLLAVHDVGSNLLACQLDDNDTVLHIITTGRIWSRLRFTGDVLCQMDSATASQKYSRVEQQVSHDGTKLAVLHIGLREWVACR
jgi:hypothetical protein